MREGRLYRKSKVNPLLFYNPELELNDLWKLASTDCTRRKFSDRRAHPPQQWPRKASWHQGAGAATIRRMALQMKKRQRPTQCKGKEMNRSQDCPVPQSSEGLKLEVLLPSFREKNYWWLLGVCVAGRGRGRGPSHLIEGLQEGVKALGGQWDLTPSAQWDLPSFTVTETSPPSRTSPCCGMRLSGNRTGKMKNNHLQKLVSHRIKTPFVWGLQQAHSRVG